MENGNKETDKYYEYKSTSYKGRAYRGSGIGCGGCFSIIVIAAFILYLIGKFA